MKGAALKALIGGVLLSVVGFGAGIYYFQYTEGRQERPLITIDDVPPLPVETPPGPGDTQTPPDEPGPGENGPGEELPWEQAPEFTEVKTPPEDIPKGEQMFRWDFSSNYKYVYDYEQKFSMKISRRVKSDSATATMAVESKENNTAAIVLSGMVLKSDPDMRIPPESIDGFSNDSKIPEPAASKRASLQLLFHLPAGAIELGKSAKIPAKLPVETDGHVLWAEGEATLTLKEYVTIDDHVCAKFHTETRASSTAKAKHLPCDYEFTIEGTGVLYFDTEDLCFHSGNVTLSMVVNAQAKAGSPFGFIKRTSQIETSAKYIRNKYKEELANEE